MADLRGSLVRRLLGEILGAPNQDLPPSEPKPIPFKASPARSFARASGFPFSEDSTLDDVIVRIKSFENPGMLGQADHLEKILSISDKSSKWSQRDFKDTLTHELSHFYFRKYGLDNETSESLSEIMSMFLADPEKVKKTVPRLYDALVTFSKYDPLAVKEVNQMNKALKK